LVDRRIPGGSAQDVASSRDLARPWSRWWEGASGWWGWIPVALFVGTRAATGVVLWLSHRHEPQKPFVDLVTSWDARWNTVVAQSGYIEIPPPSVGGHPLQTLAFLPIVPTAARVVHAITGLREEYAGLLVSGACGLAGAVVLWRLIRDRFWPCARDSARCGPPTPRPCCCSPS
jgi:hypothetical protein